jgi:hypothetical protein
MTLRFRQMWFTAFLASLAQTMRPKVNTRAPLTRNLQ